ncbi:hypothetical protein [Sphingopyxis yananensis]|uniref:hypothetical protein n=1 Tax=Sphingopyxis yananensis TaxID=2886687 RepID=UPI001D111E62|nr:hypothetical protein [Sphingopyxis yananensis]MCC2603111.1 hypothetical protein [Sphingopyxis yananensis]
MTTGIDAATVKRVAAMRRIGIAHSYHMRNIEFGTSSQTVIGRIAMRVLDPIDISERLKGRAWQRHLKNVALASGLQATEQIRVLHVHFEQKLPFSTVRMEVAANSLAFFRQSCA